MAGFDWFGEVPRGKPDEEAIGGARWKRPRVQGLVGHSNVQLGGRGLCAGVDLRELGTYPGPGELPASDKVQKDSVESGSPATLLKPSFLLEK